MAGTISISADERIRCNMGPLGKMVRKITVDWTGDASDGTVPALNIPSLKGYIIKVITNPGGTAPTDNYDIALYDPDATDLDVLDGDLADRDTANSEQVFPVGTGGSTPVFVCADFGENHSLAVTGNSVNSATGQIILYVIEG